MVTEDRHTPGVGVTGREQFHMMVLVSGAGNTVEALSTWVTSPQSDTGQTGLAVLKIVQGHD